MTETSTEQAAADHETAVRYERDADGIVTLTLDDPTASANTMNDLYIASMEAAVDRLYAEVAEDEQRVTGVVIASAKKTFFAGGNLTTMVQATRDDAAEVFATCERVKAALRRLELLGRPVVAAINGAALGGGYEICLAANHRIVVDDPKAEVGLPEASLGLLPGGGGVTRTVRMLGIQPALMDVLLQGTRFKPAQALEKGLVDEVVATREELVPTAKAWIRANPDAAQNPWDAPGYKMPGGTPSNPKLAAFLPAFPALLRQQTKGADYPAQRAILSAAVEGAQVDFDTASRIESRYLTSLVVDQGSKNMIQAFFFDLQAINAGKLRPEGVSTYRATKVGVLGAGMMGAGIAYSCARAGMQVVLKDVALESAEKGRAYSEKLLDKAIARGRSTEEKKAELLGRITPTADPADLAGCDLVIEAVFEDPGLKKQVFAEVAAHVNADALLCSNTSTLPITELAAGVDRPEDFIGLHFFSPVDKMPLVEIIRGAQTSDEALAKAYDVVQQIRKTPIVVNDSRGFYTSRVIGTMVNEGLAMLAEGVHPVSLERATTQAGYPVGVLQLSDELNMELFKKISTATRTAVEAAGRTYEPHPAEAVIDTMIGLGRPSRLKGAGFYEYDESGRRLSLWKGLADTFPVAADHGEAAVPFADVQERMLFAEAIETAKCFEEGVITSAAAANIGSIMGIGFPPNTGGAAQFMQGYEHDGRIGLAAFVARAEQLAERYGERFRPTAYLRELAASGGRLPA
ncbi:3-hydroxyacyl-CoA dehydrogenase NAD-binding domain-containing protein [Nocardioides panaciterrulae]|uniref:3-hydroxyacyl-CoA dehydrogenase/enoyl-CoA hydratase/3-hydroxybutyryl-CoA epimerase n=1 Tax=Nocardioides panaciterrulae TaxID=661492 RepID=A0A7Y9J9A7_9ACTN|nr:3-hydroxyacyl-CoA dehydrogenase NAD-binding domain-containing protein [Nocardioides panaciterrulae]NYD40133.1 3-hydroxyacyl-CoA dehydrogenase/enoyl-CoA hydratase/3-hydroxybutyryl-CoA epimerase [Nocardioides panaciterrulae]